MGKRFKIILVAFLLTGTLYFIFTGLTKGKSFLIPLVTAIILGMVMNPVALKLKKWGLNWGLSVFLSDLIIVCFIAFMVFLLAAQTSQIAGNWQQIESRLNPKIEKFQNFVNNKLNMSVSGLKDLNKSSGASSGQEQQKENKQSQGENKDTANQGQQQGSNPSGNSQTGTSKESGQSGSMFQFSKMKDTLAGIGMRVFGFLGDLLLMLVYIFFFMFYQRKFEDALVGLAPEEKRKKIRSTLRESAGTAQHYLFGRFILILILAGMYMLGYSLAGLKYAVFISLIAALFSLIPYVGNLVGLLLALAASFISGGGSGQLIAIVAIYSVVQFVESYMLEPFVVGEKVDLNPVVIIVGVVLGGVVWGIMGMILAIPVLGIIKVVFDNVDVLNPVAYALDERGISSGGGWSKKIKDWFQHKIKGKK